MSSIVLSKSFRPDLTDYKEVIQAITDEINTNAIHVMSNTDIVKMCIERGYQSLFPGKPHVVSRKRFEKWPF